MSRSPTACRSRPASPMRCSTAASTALRPPTAPAALTQDAPLRVVSSARGPRGLETGLGGSINVETIELLAQNVAGETRGGLANVPDAQGLPWDPGVITTFARGFA